MHIFLNTQKKLREGWWVAIFFLVLASFLFPLILLADRFSYKVSLTHQLIILLLASILCQFLYNKRLQDLAGRINFTWFRELGTGLIYGAVLMLVPAMLLTLMGVIQWQTNNFSSNTLFSGLLLFASVAVAEELLFRGFIFQRFIGAIGPWGAQFIIAGLFLLTHIDNPGMSGITKILASFNIFIASVLFGIAYIKTKRLSMPIGLHFMANFIQGTVLGFGVSGGSNESSLLKPIFTTDLVWLTGGTFGLEASIVGLLCIIGTTVLFYFRKTIILD
jgi:membrane protease YdiL (CAAX protease family)